MPEGDAIEAVVCDFGGVLTTPLFEAFAGIQEEFGIESGDLAGAMRLLTEREGENPLFPLERGEIAEDAFLAKLDAALQELLGRETHVHRFREALQHDPAEGDLAVPRRHQHRRERARILGRIDAEDLEPPGAHGAARGALPAGEAADAGDPGGR